MNIKSLPKEERPREKLITHGAKSLSNPELLALLLGTGNKNESVMSLSRKLFLKYDIKSLSRITRKKLEKEFGIGNAKASQIIACFELGRRLLVYKEKETQHIKNAKDVVKMFAHEIGDLKQEHVKAIYLDARNKLIHEKTLFIGSLQESIVSPREIFKEALEENASSIILVHNHPSGDPSPSMEDIEVTQNLLKAAQILDVSITDHIIIAGKKYFSFKEKNLL